MTRKRLYELAYYSALNLWAMEKEKQEKFPGMLFDYWEKARREELEEVRALLLEEERKEEQK